MENLNKENFWNNLQDNFPNGMKVFCDWIDEYKKKNHWADLFNETYGGDCGNGSCGFPDTHNAPKFHDLPLAMQLGIWIEFLADQNELIGAPEHNLTFEEYKSMITEVITALHLDEFGKMQGKV